ncbi:hypothetical protein B0H19DRAFT_958626 [Mycena capillaripes]|nr:hypothetical protein B0H19DRAFT_958626 [Mycena capillaripes]
MSVSNQQVAAARTAIQSVTTGTAANQDAWMTQWCSTNWGDLLQPAPLSIALLGSVLVIASSVDDFSTHYFHFGDFLAHWNPGLDSKAPPGAAPFTWTYARHPDSFKACLQQMVGNGYLAFQTAHKNMEVISTNSGQIPNVIKNAVPFISKGSAEAVLKGLRTTIEDLNLLSQRCRDEAKESEQAFRDMCGLAQEMVLACTYTAGTAEQALAQNKVLRDYLNVMKEASQISTWLREQFADPHRQSYLKAENEFKAAIEDFPSGWDLLGSMAICEAFTDVVSGIGNALSSMATLNSQGSKAGMNSFSSKVSEIKDKPADPAQPPVAPTTSPNGVDSQPNSDALSDPATPLVPLVLTCVHGIKTLLTGKDGKPDWNKIRSKDSSTSGAAYIRAFLKLKEGHLDTSKSVARELSTHIGKALTILDDIIEKAGTVAATNEDALADKVAPINELLMALESLQTSVNLVLQQPGSSGKGLATPNTPADIASGSGPKLALQNAMMKVDQTKAQLEASRDSYQKAADRLVAQQQEITKMITELTQVSLTGATLEQMLPVLTKAVGSFTILRAQFSQLAQFFDSVASLLVDVMGPSVDRWVATLTTAAKQVERGQRENHLAGVTISTFTRDMMYRQMLPVLKAGISMLANKISTVYLSVSHDYIIPAQMNVGNMLQFSASTSVADKAALRERLGTAQAELKRSSALASAEIATRVSNDQKTFEASINARLETIVKAVQVAVPAATDSAVPVPAHIKAVTDAHVVDTDTTKALQAEANPMFDIDSMM